MSNMDEFNKATAVILDTLYESFPLRIHLRNDTFGADKDEQTLHIYSDTIIFLEREGFLRYESLFSYSAAMTMTRKEDGPPIDGIDNRGECDGDVGPRPSISNRSNR